MQVEHILINIDIQNSCMYFGGKRIYSRYTYRRAHVDIMYVTGALASKHVDKREREREREKKYFFQERDLG